MARVYQIITALGYLVMSSIVYLIICRVICMQVNFQPNLTLCNYTLTHCTLVLQSLYGVKRNPRTWVAGPLWPQDLKNNWHARYSVDYSEIF